MDDVARMKDELRKEIKEEVKQQIKDEVIDELQNQEKLTTIAVPKKIRDRITTLKRGNENTWETIERLLDSWESNKKGENAEQGNQQ